MNKSDYLLSSNQFSALARALVHVSLRLMAILLLGCCLLLSLPVSSLFGQTSGSFDAAHLSDSGLLIVGLDLSAGGDAGLAELRAQGFEIETYWPRLGLASLRAAELGAADQPSLLERAVERVQTVSSVAHVSGDVALQAAVQPMPVMEQVDGSALLHLASLPDDPFIDQQWAIARTAAPDGWQISQGASHVTIALIDSGLNSSHEDLAAEVLWQNRAEADGDAGVDDDGNGFVDDFSGWDWIDEDGVPDDPYGHGSHTGGIIAAASDNGIGIAGFAPGVRILPLRILDAYGGGQLSDLIAALDYALAQEVDVVNLSLTTNSDQPALAQAVDVLADAGILLVAASGNQAGPVVWPAAYPGTLAVAATTADDTQAKFSNYGPAIDLAAPGEAILSLYRDNDYALMDGTSMAVPHVAALGALLAVLRPDLRGPELGRLMQMTAVDVNAATLPGHDPELGAGRIDFGAALFAASEALQLTPVVNAEPELPVFASTAVRYEWSLSVPGLTGQVMPVIGAQGTFRIYTAGDPARLLSAGVVQSDEEGRLVVGFVAPDLPGEYLVELTIGAVRAVRPLLVSAPLAEVRLEPQFSAVQAASAPQLITIAVRAAQGQPVEAPLRIELATNLGFLGDERVQRVEIPVEGGQGEVLFRPGPAVGIAQLTASIGGVTGSTEIEILPGVPESVRLPSLPAQIAVMDEPVVVELEILVADRFGNPVADGTEVELAVSDGNLIILDRTTAQGVLVANLMVSAADVSPVQLRATVLDYPAQVEANLTLQSNHQWLPIVKQTKP